MADPLDRLNAALTDRYVVERKIGSGGTASVYLARDLKHHRQVALNVLDPDVAATVGAERFLREIETAANLIHPHILPLFHSGHADGLLFYVMPYVEGESLQARARQTGDRRTSLIAASLRAHVALAEGECPVDPYSGEIRIEWGSWRVRSPDRHGEIAGFSRYSGCNLDAFPEGSLVPRRGRTLVPRPGGVHQWA